MENKPVEAGKEAGRNQAPLAQVQIARAPWQILIVVGIMCIAAVSKIVHGIPFLLVFGIGIVSILEGMLIIKFARSIYRLERMGYIGGMILLGIETLLSLRDWRERQDAEGTMPVLYLIIAAIYVGCMIVLYYHRQRFVGKRTTIINK